MLFKMFQSRPQTLQHPRMYWRISSLRKLFEVVDQQYSDVSIVVLILNLVMELASVSLYVYTSEVTGAMSVSSFFWDKSVLITELALSIIFFLEWVLLLFGEEDKMRYCLSWLSIVNAMTSVPMIVIGIGGLVDPVWRGYWVPMYLRVWWLRECVLMLLDYPQMENLMLEVTREVSRFLTTLFAVVCTCVGTLQIVESTTGAYMDMYDALYCMIVAFGTIGYGDVTPTSTPARLLMILFIVVAISYFMPLFQKLASIYRQRLHYNVYNSHGGRKLHVIFSGVFTEVAVDICLQDFFGGWRRYLDVRIVLLSPEEHPASVKLLANLPWFRDRVVLMIGDLTKEADLKRADASHADAIFLFGETSPSDFHTDYRLIQQSFAVNQYDSALPQYMFLKNERNTRHVAAYAAGVVELERLLYHLLGLGVTVPGSIPLIMNLLRTYESLPLDMTRSRYWVEQYEWSLRNEIFCVEISDALRGRKFYSIVKLFVDWNVTPVGIVGVGGVVELNPFRISGTARKLIVIARSLDAVQEATGEVEEKFFLNTSFGEVAEPDSPHLGMGGGGEGIMPPVPPSDGKPAEAIEHVLDAYDFENHFVVIDLSIAKDKGPETEGAREGTLNYTASSVFHVVRSIRQSYAYNDIVLLTKDTSFSPYFDRHWNGLKGDLSIKHMDGCGLNLNDLRRCNLKKSAGIVILNFGDTSCRSTSGLSMLVDLSIQSILPSSHNIPVVVGLDSLQHLSLFPPSAEDYRLRQKAEQDFFFEPNFIIGNAVSRHMLLPLAHRAYFMEEYIDIIDMMVSGVDEETPSLGRISLSLAPETVTTYGDVVDYCLNLQYLPIALHRCIYDPKELGLSGQRFVMTNPSKTFAVDREKDAVFYILPTR